MLPLTPMERSSAILWYLHNQRAMLEGKHISRMADYNLTYEKYSSAFVDAVDISVLDVEEYLTPLKAQVVSRVRPVWNEFSMGVIDKLNQQKLWQSKYLRGGGVYMSNVQAKRLDKWFSQQRTLINDVPQLWTTSYYVDHVRAEVNAFMKSTRARILLNIEAARKHPELILGNKPPSTGTGLKVPQLATRADAAKNFPMYADQYQDQVTFYWDALTEALNSWPEMGAIIDTGPMFKGAAGGRSDADFELQPDGTILTRTKTRTVGPGFESLMSNNLLNPKAYRRQLLDQISSEYAIRPWDAKGISEIVLLPDATRPGKATDKVILSADLGFCHSTRSIQPDGSLNLGTETDSFGADAVLGSGIFFRTRYGPVYAFLLSGMVITQDIYIVMMSNIIAEWARRRKISKSSLSWTQIGDDIHFAIDRDLVPALLAEFGSYLKLKGMFVEGDWTGHFYLGQYIWRHKDGDRVIMAIYPRAVKSETSAKANLTVELPPAKIGDTLHLDVPMEAKHAAGETIQRYPELFFYDGETARAKTVITRDLIRARLELARVGIADWAAEGLFDEDDTLVTFAPPAAPVQSEQLAKSEGNIISGDGRSVSNAGVSDPVSADAPGTTQEGMKEQHGSQAQKDATTAPPKADVTPAPKGDNPEVLDEVAFTSEVNALKDKLPPEIFEAFVKAWKAHEEWHSRQSIANEASAPEG